LKEHVKPLAQSGGAVHTSLFCSVYLLAHDYGDTGVKGRQTGQDQGNEPDEEQDDTAMEE
jgi:hypothetical protein